jgi:putative toxin-antitoxin system antitoxin component (TIGR02293 family)
MAAFTSEHREEVLQFLGGSKVFRRRIADVRDLEAAVRRGFPYGAFEALLEALELHAKDLTEILGVPPRTLARRRQARRLSPTESDRLCRVAFVLRQATEVFGSLDKARDWLNRPNRALGNEQPISRLDTEIGEREVEDVLNRINHGIYS